MPNDLQTICAFSGHRPSKFPWRDNEGDDRCILLKNALNTQIEKLASAGVTDFLTGMARGVDTWAALLVLELREQNPKLRLHCILPCREQAEKWATADQDIYFSVLRQADSVVYVNRHYNKGCMLARNRFMVEHSGLLLAVYNGEQRGGTAATVRWAQKLGREIIILDPLALDIIYE